MITISNKKYGLAKEREAKEILKNDGTLYVSRVRGSFSAYDIQAFYPDKCLLVSVKATKQKYFSMKAEINKLKQVKLPDYCEGELWLWLSPRADRKERGWMVKDILKKRTGLMGITLPMDMKTANKVCGTKIADIKVKK